MCVFVHNVHGLKIKTDHCEACVVARLYIRGFPKTGFFLYKKVHPVESSMDDETFFISQEVTLFKSSVIKIFIINTKYEANFN